MLEFGLGLNSTAYRHIGHSPRNLEWPHVGEFCLKHLNP